MDPTSSATVSQPDTRHHASLKMPAAFRMLTARKPQNLIPTAQPTRPRLASSSSLKTLRNQSSAAPTIHSSSGEPPNDLTQTKSLDASHADQVSAISTPATALANDSTHSSSNINSGGTAPDTNGYGPSLSEPIPLFLQQDPSNAQLSQNSSIDALQKIPTAVYGQSASQLALSMENSRRSATLIRTSMDLAATSQLADRNNDRDRYGFKKKTSFVSEQEFDTWWETYQPYLRRRKRKWLALMKENGLHIENGQPVRFPPKSEKLKRYIRKGIPAEWRGHAWWWYAKGPEKLSAHPGMYDKLCKQTLTLKNNDTELIERDLNRTFPDNIYFRGDNVVASTTTVNDPSQETPLISALRRVLRAFSVYQPSVGYCQSLNFVAGILLLFMDEEKAFWMLVIITQRYLPGLHEVSLEGVNIEQGVLMLFIKQSLPEMWNKVGVNFDGNHYDNILIKLPPITLCTASWFMSAYISILPTETMLRVWDCFFFEESKVFFRVALTLLKVVEPEVRNMTDQMEVFQKIQNCPKKMIDASKLMEACFKRRNAFANVSQDEIIKLRLFVAERRKQAEQAAHKEQLNNGTRHFHSPEDGVYAGMSSTDLEAFSKLKPLHIGFQANVVRRMKSLKEAGHPKGERKLSNRASSLSQKSKK